MADRTRIILFTGKGKGKTTAALGMALRACGHNMRVGMIEFVKSRGETGEIAASEFLPNFDIQQTGEGWIPERNDPEYPKHARAAQNGLQTAEHWATSEKYDLLILDEICVALSTGLLEEKEVLAMLSQAPSNMIIVLTGRGAPDALIDRADTVTDMTCIKHGLQTGFTAQKGAEY